MELELLLKQSVEHGASDLHLSTKAPPILRKDGEIFSLSDNALTALQVQELISEAFTPDQAKTFNDLHEVDFALQLEGVARFRVNAFQQQHGPSAVFRTIPNNVLSLKQLRAPDILTSLAELPRGLVLVTGPTGSGKSTTLAAMIDHINQTRAQHILTIEDPIEFVHANKKSLVNQREVHRDTLSFSAALRSSLREDPDVILVGELRDLETIRLAMTAAETGHLVFATLHTTSAPKTIDRIIDVFPGDEKEMVRAMLSESLQAVVSQLLIKSVHGGRVAAHEIMIANPAIKNLIRENKIAQMYSTIQTSATQGMQTMEQALSKLSAQNEITKEDVERILGKDTRRMLS